MKRITAFQLSLLHSLVVMALCPLPTRAQASKAAGQAATVADVTQLQLDFDVTEGRAGGRVEVTARLRDAAGRARDGALHLDVDAGTVGKPVRASAGVYTAHITVPAALGARRSLLVVASAGQAAASATLPLVSGPAASIKVEPPEDLTADGANHPIWIGVADAHGNPSAETPRVTVVSGTLGEPMSIGPGEWMVDYQPPRRSSEGVEQVQVRAGTAIASTPLRLVPVAAIVTLAPRAGVVLGVAGGPTLALGAEVGAWAPVGRMDLGLLLAVDWWGAKDTNGLRGPAGTIDLESSHMWLPVTLSLASRHPLGARGTVTFSLGGGAALVTNRAELPDQPKLTESAWTPTALAGVAVSMRTRFGAPFVELRGGWVGDPGLETFRDSAWPVMFLLGSRFDAY